MKRQASRLMKMIALLFLGLFGAVLPATAQERSRTEIMIQNGRAGLDSQLVTPAGGEAVKGAVVFVMGSGGGNVRDYVPGYKEQLVESIFLPRDIAILYVNKRGAGDSSGSWKWGSIERRTDDILAAVNYLRTLPEIDPDAIGVIGHSQGGWVVQLAGSLDPRIAFVVSLAGPTVTVAEQDLARVELGLRCEGYTDDDLARELAKRDRAHQRMIAVGGWFPFFELRYMHNILPYDPADALRGLSQPTLLAFGELDSMVPPEQNSERFNEIFPTGAPKNITWFTTPRSDHMFRITDTVCFDYYASIDNPYSEEFRAVLTGWVDENVVR